MRSCAHGSTADLARRRLRRRGLDRHGLERLQPAGADLGRAARARPGRGGAARLRGADPAARRLRTGRAGALGLIFTDRLPFAFEDQAAVDIPRAGSRASSRLGRGAAADSDLAEPARRAPASSARRRSTGSSSTPRRPAIRAWWPRSSAGCPRWWSTSRSRCRCPRRDRRPRRRADGGSAHREAGHERVGVVGSPEFAQDDPRWSTTSPTRARRLPRRPRCCVGPDLVAAAPPAGPRRRWPVRALLGGDSAPTAVLAMSDTLAAGVVRGAADLGGASAACRWSASTTFRWPARPTLR